MRGASRLLGTLTVAAAASVIALEAQPPPASPTWITAWATSQQVLGDTAITNATVRMVARVTVPGRAVRIRVDNGYGTTPLDIARASVGLRIQGARLAEGSVRPLTFVGRPSVSVAPGGSVWTDPVALDVRAQQDVAASFYIPGIRVRPSQHTNAVVTSYRTADGSGDSTLDENRAPFTLTTTQTWWLKAIDVETVENASASAIVTFGDSITDGTCTTLDAHDRWGNLFSWRLTSAADADRALRRPVRLQSVVNEGIGGNTVTRAGLVPPPDSTPGVERVMRDVLGHHGVRDVVVFMGTNDIRRGAPASQVVDGLSTIVRALKAASLRVHGATIIPRHNVAPTLENSGWNDAKTAIREEVNRWIRTSGAFSNVIDFDAVVRDPAQVNRMLPAFNCGDGIHPSPAGYYAMGAAVDLRTFTIR